MRSPLPLALLAFAVGRLTAARAAEPASDGTEEQVVAAELEEIQEDPTIIKPRIWLDTEWNKFKDGSSNIQPTAAELWSWRISSNQDWGVRLTLEDEPKTHYMDPAGAAETGSAFPARPSSRPSADCTSSVKTPPRWTRSE